MTDSAENLNHAMRAIDDVWQELAASPMVAVEQGRNPTGLPDIGEAAIQRRSATGRALVARIDTIDADALPRDVALTLAIARGRAVIWAREADWYWLVFDPLGAGFFSLFAPTAYSGGFLLSQLAPLTRRYRFEERGDLDRYLGLVSDYARLVDQMHERTKGQAERGVRIPRAQLAQSISLLKALRAGVIETLSVDPARVAGWQADRFLADLGQRIDGEVLPAFDRFLAFIGAEDYAAQAPDAVGLSQFPGGEEVYRALVKHHTTQDLTPERVHALGLERMRRVRSDMQRLFDDIGFAGSPQDYLAKVAADPKWRAEGPDEVGAFFRRYVDRIAPHVAGAFNFGPTAGHDVAPLPDALTGSMTFGFYSPPRPGQDKGLYFFNAPNLSKNPLPNIAALNYHELVPGHHFHLASQRENKSLHPIRQHSFVNAYNEGWAEYAATLAGEMGMYEEPEEKFGRYMMDAFLTCRLVVDTGMNALGWTLERARDYMRENGFMPEQEIQTESLRYSCDIPGQSLAYKLGDEFILSLRERMMSKLGGRFDLKAFHDAVLKPGGLPLPLLERHVAAETERLLAQTTH